LARPCRGDAAKECDEIASVHFCARFERSDVPPNAEDFVKGGN
jgi:hypothetical protein